MEGEYLIPGFIDVHSHGGYGLDGMDASADEIDWMVRQMAAKEGITSYFCTTMTQTSENVESAIEEYQRGCRERIDQSRGFIWKDRCSVDCKGLQDAYLCSETGCRSTEDAGMNKVATVLRS
ncbi:MAG: hypothetical protein ACLT1J_02105 [Mediterraneibacter gnavus]